MKQFDVLILGGGAAGLMCAAHVNQNSDLHVGIIEGNDQLARKLRISGGGNVITSYSIHYTKLYETVVTDTALVEEAASYHEKFKKLHEKIAKKG